MKTARLGGLEMLQLCALVCYLDGTVATCDMICYSYRKATHTGENAAGFTPF